MPIGTPFTNGQLQLSQQGADAYLTIDFDGNAPGALPETFIVFQNVQASSLTAHNLGGFAPNGAASPGITVSGTAGSDPLTGNSGDDLISGGGGNDFLFGSAGNDSLVGGDDIDWLSGETGNDILNGGAGADLMAGGLGSDTFYVDNAGDVIDEYDPFGTNIVYASVGYTLTAGAYITLLTTESIAGT